MRILIVRHGEAVDEADGLGDAGRWLTPKGREVSRRVARWVAEDAGRRPAVIWTSPLVRAVQTAEILAEAAGVLDVEVVRDLSPGGDLGRLERVLRRDQAGGALALVGHEPSLSELAGALLEESNWPGFKKSGVCGLDVEARGAAKFAFLLVPKGMRIVTDLRAVD